MTATLHLTGRRPHQARLTSPAIATHQRHRLGDYLRVATVNEVEGGDVRWRLTWAKAIGVADLQKYKKAFHIFLKHFFVIYKNWKPLDLDNSTEAALGVAYGEESENPDEIIIGCSTAHPAEIIVILIEEVTNITAMVTECISGSSSSLVITPEGFRVLKCLTIMTRSMHNCKVLGYYGGIQKPTALMKGANKYGVIIIVVVFGYGYVWLKLNNLTLSTHHLQLPRDIYLRGLTVLIVVFNKTDLKSLEGISEDDKKLVRSNEYFCCRWSTAKAMEAEKVKRKLERDNENENDGAGVYSATLKKHYLLADDKWKEDNMPEILDGHNVYDFID
ncbi:unnamed protein product [Lactuca virosa]|uniref:NOG C-terminal domain-containing protein n=1 Tax=Lactuca virosa TaxID=75947 RepID=A0AAU9N0Z0_9ASTR|nr:unnamed protein product [Lactuca virosa]